jgi:hypothetical protein
VSTLPQVLHKVADLTDFTPTDEQKRAKAEFWSRASSGEAEVPSEISLALALRLGAPTATSKWWSIPGFQDWFTNRNEFKENLEFLANIAVDQLGLIIRDSKANPSARVAAVKLILEAARKMPSKSTDSEQYLDQKVAEMDRKELEDYIQRQMTRITPN